MIETLLAVKLDTLEELLPFPDDKSGLMPWHNPVYDFGYKQSPYPTLILSYTLYDEDRDYIPPGYYELALSNDKKFLLLSESKILKAKIPVVKLVEDEKALKASKEKMDELNANLQTYTIKNKRKKIKEVKLEIQEHTKRIQLSTKAEIEDTKQGYYIIKYEKDFTKAWGYVGK